MQVHVRSMSFMNPEATKTRKNYWDNIKLISKKRSLMSTKTKDAIVDTNVNTSKITRQRKNAITHLAKNRKK